VPPLAPPPGGGLKLRISDEGRERIQELMDDPGLLDLNRPAAISTFLVKQVEWEPSEEAVYELAKAVANRGRKRTRKGEEQEEEKEPTDAHLAAARTRLVAGCFELLVTHTQVIEKAHKAQETRRILLDQVLPLLLGFAKTVGTLIQDFMPPLQQAQFMVKLDEATAVLVAKVSEASETIKVRS